MNRERNDCSEGVSYGEGLPKGTLHVSQIIAYLNGWEGAPSARKVFDHYWEIMAYALSEEERQTILSSSPEEGVEMLYALGGEVLNAYPKVNLLETYEYWEEDVGVEGLVGEFAFVYPKRPIDNLRAGVALGKNMSASVADQYCQYDSFFVRSVHVYRGDELVDVMKVSPWYKKIYLPVNSDLAMRGIDQGTSDAEEEWALLHDFKWEFQETGKLKFTDYFHDEEVRKDIYVVDGVLESEMFGDLGEFDENLTGSERDERIAEIVSGSIVGYLIEHWGEREVWNHLRTLNYCYSTHWYSIPPNSDNFPNRPVDLRVLERFPDVAEAICSLSVKDAALQLMMLAYGERHVQAAFARAKPRLNTPFSRVEEEIIAQLDKPFSYTEEEVSSQGEWGGARFELPKTPAQLLQLGAQEADSISRFAWSPWSLSWKEGHYEFPYLMFSAADNRYLGYVTYFRGSLRFNWFDFLDSSDAQLDSLRDLVDSVKEWLEDDKVSIWGRGLSKH